MSQAHSGLGPRWSPSPSLPQLHTPARRERAREPYALLDTTGLDNTIQASHDDVRHHELECDSLHVDSDHVATTADGHTWCDNHWEHTFPSYSANASTPARAIAICTRSRGLPSTRQHSNPPAAVLAASSTKA